MDKHTRRLMGLRRSARNAALAYLQGMKAQQSLTWLVPVYNTDLLDTRVCLCDAKNEAMPGFFAVFTRNYCTLHMRALQPTSSWIPNVCHTYQSFMQ